jgi:hypothetical protein
LEIFSACFSHLFRVNSQNDFKISITEIGVFAMTFIMRIIFIFVLALNVFIPSARCEKMASRWSEQKANKWYAKQPWMVGCNYAPATAINQLEMWQADTFDPATIDRELGWAEGLGMNVVRVFLHDMLWQQDKEGFLKRVDQFLAIADKHKIKVILVPLDSVWNPYSQLGKQPEPTPFVHNSGWVQSPHIDLLKDPARHDELEPYIKGLLTKYKNDKRVLFWDLYNEPDNQNPVYKKYEPDNKSELALALLKKLFKWGREVNPDQPLSVCFWKGDWQEDKLNPVNRFTLENSDVINFHSYADFVSIQKEISLLGKYNRPVICTEYMARPRGSTFAYILPLFKKHNIGAVNWGFVSGKSQTIYPWDSWEKKYTAEPVPWFHDVFRTDGTPYDKNETEFIKMMTSR